MEDNLKSQWSELADTLGQTAMDILDEAPVTVTGKRFSDPKVIAIMLMARTLSNFNGVFTLIENDLVVEARILVRCCFENTFWIAGLLSHGDKFVAKMIDDDMRSRHVQGEMALRMKSHLLEDAEKRLRQQLRAINKKWPDAKPLNPKDVALSGLLRNGYRIYSQLSADAAHPTMASLNRHVGHTETDGDGFIEVVPTPKDREVILTWSWACYAMMGACVVANEILGGTLAGDQLGQIENRYQALTTRSKAV